MDQRRAASLLAATVILLAPPGDAQDPVAALTLDQALAKARERAPIILTARMRVEEARGRLTGASVRLRDNPLVEAGAGTRSSATGHSREAELGLMQTFETGGRRTSRIAAADAALERATADVDVATSGLLRGVAVSFYSALHAAEHVRLATDNEGLALEALRTAERRNELGEVPLLDVHVARVGWARNRSEVQTAGAASDAALGELRLLLGLDPREPLAVEGDLRGRPTFDLQDLLARAAERPELRVLAAAMREAEADTRLGQGYSRPDLGLGIRYEREEGADVFLGGVSFVLPVFERGQGLREEASARTRRLGLELDTARRAIEIEVRAAFDVWRHRMDAVTEMEREGLASLGETDRLARRGYENGAFSVGELLLLRRESVEIRRQYLDRLLDAAIATVELEGAAGAVEAMASADRP